MKLVIGCDHGGFELKQEIIKHLSSRADLEIVDKGCDSTASVDYPVYAKAVAEAVAAKEIETSAGGGAVVVKATGDKVIKEIIIKKDVVDPDDVEMLQDLVLTAVNEALKKADSMMEQEMGSFNIPGLF